MEKIKKTSDSLSGNIFALAIVQASNYILPLVSLPYLVRVLGAESFGKVVFAQTFMLYFLLLVEYGFSWSATRKIAANRDDHVFLGKIFINVWAAQWLLAVISLAILISVLFFFDGLHGDIYFYMAAFLVVPGNILFPVWFLQGIEKLQLQSILQFFSRLLGLLMIFVWVRSDQDGIWVFFANSLASMIAGFFSVFLIFKNKYFKACVPTLSEVWKELGDGFSMFLSKVSISFYTMLIPLVLGWVAGPVALAYFNVADKLRGGAQSLIYPISQAIFPRISHMILKNEVSAYFLIKRSAIAILLISGIASLMLFFCAKPLIELIAGEGFGGAVSVLQCISPVPLLVGISNLLGVQLMLPLQLNKAFNRILCSAAFLCVLILWPMVNFAGANGAAITLMLVEFWVSALMVIYLWNKRFLGFKKGNK